MRRVTLILMAIALLLCMGQTCLEQEINVNQCSLDCLLSGAQECVMRAASQVPSPLSGVVFITCFPQYVGGCMFNCADHYLP